MNIALVTYALQVGGVETFIKVLSDYIDRHGNSVTIYETLSKGRASDSFSEAGYRVEQILPQLCHSRIHHSRRIAKRLASHDVVLLNDVPYAQAGIGLLPARTVVIPVLHMYMTSMVKNATSNRKYLDFIAAVCPAARDSAIQSGVEPEKVICIPNGIEVPEVWPKENKNYGSPIGLYAIYVGAINHIQKGTLYLPEILNLLCDGKDFHLDIIGDGPDMNELLQQIRVRNLEPQITVHGTLPNTVVKEKLKMADILIMPSHFEGLPITLLEAMSCGVVPVCSRLPGSTDFVVEHGVEGILPNVGDVEGFKDALNILNSDRALLRKMSRASWHKIKSTFSNGRMGESYLGLIYRSQAMRLNNKIQRAGEIDITLLGDFPYLPLFMVRPFRKILRSIGLYPKPVKESLLFPLKNS